MPRLNHTPRHGDRANATPGPPPTSRSRSGRPDLATTHSCDATAGVPRTSHCRNTPPSEQGRRTATPPNLAGRAVGKRELIAAAAPSTTAGAASPWPWTHSAAPRHRGRPEPPPPPPTRAVALETRLAAADREPQLRSAPASPRTPALTPSIRAPPKV
jgi:hypothetical protein